MLVKLVVIYFEVIPPLFSNCNHVTPRKNSLSAQQFERDVIRADTNNVSIMQSVPLIRN
jgi:hypothetical protein